MKLGTSTNLIYIRPNGERLHLNNTLELLKKAGFQYVDFNTYDHTLPGSPLLGDTWEEWIDEVQRKAKELNLSFAQCHGYTYNFMDPNMTEVERKNHELLEKRVFTCLKKLGCEVCVIHPETDFTQKDTKKSFAGNVEHLIKLLKETEELGFKIALENMSDMNIRPKQKFCTDLDELITLVDFIDDERLGICWDFEHADIMGQNQNESLLKIGHRLLATHVSDTYSKTDSTRMHALPLTGTIDWKNAVETLESISYKGIFCLEVHNYMNRMPDSAIEAGLKLAFQIGEHLLGYSNLEVKR